MIEILECLYYLGSRGSKVTISCGLGALSSTTDMISVFKKASKKENNIILSTKKDTNHIHRMADMTTMIDPSDNMVLIDDTGAESSTSESDADLFDTYEMNETQAHFQYNFEKSMWNSVMKS